MTTATPSDDVATASTADRHAALLVAYTELVAETGRRPGVRALRERARTSTDAAATWLKEHAPERRPPEIPAENLAPVLAPLWLAAVNAASQALQDEHHAALVTHVDSEQQALQDAERATAHALQLTDRAAEAEKRAEALARELTTALAEVDAAQARARKADEVAAEVRERAQQTSHEAEQATAVARAEAAALREALAAVRPGIDPKQEQS